MNPTGNIPIIEMPGGKILTQSYAILRHWGRQLGAYDGKTEDEKYWADAICDIVIDCKHPLLIGCSVTLTCDRENTLHHSVLLGQPEGRLPQTSKR